MNTVKTIVIATTLMTNIFLCAADRLNNTDWMQKNNEKALKKLLKGTTAVLANAKQQERLNNLIEALNRSDIQTARILLAEDPSNAKNSEVIKATLSPHGPEKDEYNTDQIILLICAGGIAAQITNHQAFKELHVSKIESVVVAAAATRQANSSQPCESCELNSKRLLRELGIITTSAYTKAD